MSNCGDDVMQAYLPFPAGCGGSNPTSPLQFIVRPIAHRTAKAWVEKWHYSHRIPTGQNLSYGAFEGTDLYAVIVFGIGVNPYQSRFLDARNVIEIKRLCRSEPKRAGFPMSRFIRIALRLVEAESAFDCVVAFADPAQNHEGTVYKASGFTRHGETNAEWHVVDQGGVLRHRRLAFRYARRKGITVAEARHALGLTRIQTPPKIRWTLKVGGTDAK